MPSRRGRAFVLCAVMAALASACMAQDATLPTGVPVARPEGNMASLVSTTGAAFAPLTNLTSTVVNVTAPVIPATPRTPGAPGQEEPTQVSPTAPPLRVRLVNCTDVPPGLRHTCAQQRAFGKCGEDFIVRFRYCARTCGLEPCCTDIPPPNSNYTCAQQKDFGKCQESFMTEGNYCARTCLRDPCPKEANPVPKPPSGPLRNLVGGANATATPAPRTGGVLGMMTETRPNATAPSSPTSGTTTTIGPASGP